MYFRIFLPVVWSDKSRSVHHQLLQNTEELGGTLHHFLDPINTSITKPRKWNRAREREVERIDMYHTLKFKGMGPMNELANDDVDYLEHTDVYKKHVCTKSANSQNWFSTSSLASSDAVALLPCQGEESLVRLKNDILPRDSQSTLILSQKCTYV